MDKHKAVLFVGSIIVHIILNMAQNRSCLDTILVWKPRLPKRDHIHVDLCNQTADSEIVFNTKDEISQTSEEAAPPYMYDQILDDTNICVRQLENLPNVRTLPNQSLGDSKSIRVQADGGHLVRSGRQTVNEYDKQRNTISAHQQADYNKQDCVNYGRYEPTSNVNQ